MGGGGGRLRGAGGWHIGARHTWLLTPDRSLKVIGTAIGWLSPAVACLHVLLAGCDVLTCFTDGLNVLRAWHIVPSCDSHVAWHSEPGWQHSTERCSTAGSHMSAFQQAGSARRYAGLTTDMMVLWPPNTQ